MVDGTRTGSMVLYWKLYRVLYVWTCVNFILLYLIGKSNTNSRRKWDCLCIEYVTKMLYHALTIKQLYPSLYCAAWYILNFQHWWFYLQRVWYISLRLYVGWTSQLTHMNKHFRFVYFESRVVPPTVLNRHIFLATFVSRPWFLFVCWYCRQHTIFARSLHYCIILNTCSDCVHGDCTQRNLCTSKFLPVKSRLLVRF